MKRVISFIIILVIFTVPAFAEDKFMDDYNFYAENVFHISPIGPVEDAVITVYASDNVELFPMNKSIIIRSATHFDAICSACCVLRSLDNAGNRVDQFGRIMHIYFLAKSAPGEIKIATTESGIQIAAQIDKNMLYIFVEE